MKIQTRDNSHGFTFWLPNGLVFSKLSAKLMRHVSYKYAPDAMGPIDPEKFELLITELGRIRKEFGPWELIEAEEADGTYVKITL